MLLGGAEKQRMWTVRVWPSSIAVPGNSHLVVGHRHTAYRAVSADAWPTPCGIWAADGYLPGMVHFAGFLAECALVAHSAWPG
jgi:hypothetical protein